MKDTSGRVLVSIGFLVVALMIGLRQDVMAQETPLGTPAAATPVTPNITIDQVVQQANKASSDASKANANAGNVVNNANNAVNTVNELLNFIQAASLFGGILASAFAILGARVGLRTLNDYRNEIKKAREELEAMRSGLDRETENIRIQADRSIRALALTQLGEQQLERHSAKAALSIYQQAAELDPSNRAINYILGELYVQDQQLDKGIEHLERALSAANDYAPAEAALGYALRQKADQVVDSSQRDILYAQAEERFLKALQLDPFALDINGESIQGVFGGLYKRQGRIEQAIYRYQEALKVTPQKSYPVNNLAILYYIQGDLKQAISYFERSEAMASLVLQGNPFDFWARLDRVTALIALRKRDRAMEELDRVLPNIQSPGPLESSVSELKRLERAPTPPEGIDEFITKIQATIRRLNLPPTGQEAGQ